MDYDQSFADKEAISGEVLLLVLSPKSERPQKALHTAVLRAYVW